MRILITGGAGFVGSHLADRLIARGDEVLVIDNYSTGRRDNLTPHKNLKIIEGTIADEQLVTRQFEDFQPTQVIHAAASYKDPDNWFEDVRTNALGSAIVTKESKRLGVSLIIYFQTSLCYGVNPTEQPITLDHPLKPESSYAISKTAGEYYISLGGIDFFSFRLANAYGPRNLSGPFPTFYQRLSSNKGCFVTDTRRDFIYIADLIDLIMLAIDGKGKAKRGIYHASSGSDYSIKELFDTTVKAMGIEPYPDVELRPRGDDDAYTILIDPSKTVQDFGWKPLTPLDAGVQKGVEYYNEYGVSQTFTHLKTD